MHKDRRGQNTVEYLLMLAVVVGVVLIAGVSLKRFMPDLFAKVTAPIDKIFGKGGDSSSSAGSESSSSALGGSKPWSSLLPGGGESGSGPGSGSSAGGGLTGGGQAGGGAGGAGWAGSGRSPAAGGSSGGSAYVGGGSMVPGAVSGGAAGGGSSGAGASGAGGSGAVGPGGGGFAGSGAGPGGSAQGPPGSAPMAGGRPGAGSGAGSGAGGRQDGGPGGSASAGPSSAAGTGGGATSSGASQPGQAGSGGGSGGTPSLAGIVAQAQALASLARSADPAALAQWRRLCAGLTQTDLRPPSEARRSKEFESLLRASKELADAYQNWGNLTPAQKVRALQALASIFGQAYGLPQLRVTAFDFSGEQGGILAFHRADGALLVNPASLADRDAAMDAVLHQSWHRYQEDMVTRLNSGQIPPTDDRYELVRLLAVSQGVSGPPGDYESFRAGPMEAQAHLFDGVGSMTLATLAGGRAEVRDLWGDLGRAVRGDGSVPHRKRMLILSLLGASLVVALVMGYVVIRAESGG